jgi:hypothetical protein
MRMSLCKIVQQRTFMNMGPWKRPENQYDRFDAENL